MRSITATLALCALMSLADRALASSTSCDELVLQGQAYEAANDQDRALARYGDAVQIDGSCGSGYLAMGELRARMGDRREAERVLTAGLERVPSMRATRLARAKVRRALGRHPEAEEDIRSLVDSPGAEEPDARELTIAALRALAGWYGEDRAHPAELATWRRIQFIAARASDASLTKEATAMVRALTIVVGIADPVTSPSRRDAFRLMVARAAR